MTEHYYETLRRELGNLRVPRGQTRSMRWLAEPLAVGRTASGDYEVFIRGPQLQATSVLVQRHLQHGDWRPEEGGDSFPASRILLPEAPHFASIAALISVELLRAGVASPRGQQQAFIDVEPIIEMAIRRGALAEDTLVGLIGELFILRRLLLAQESTSVTSMRTLECWQGWREGGRDFRIGTHSIEVKTTRSLTSIHKFSGLHQLEAIQLPAGDLEKLHLMSIGLAASTSVGETLPGIVESIRMLLTDAAGEVTTEFLKRVSLYGAGGNGYDHDSMQDWGAYRVKYTHSFEPRLYRIDDPGMRLLKREVLAETFVQPEDLSFTMHVPEVVSPYNPAPDWEAELVSMASSNI